MIIFDKIKKLLFTEEEIEEYVEEVEEEPKLQKNPPQQQPKQQPKQQKQPERRQPVTEVKKEREVERPTQPKRTESSTIDIKVDVPVSEKKVEKRLQPIERKDFEMPQVISPISGLKEDEMKKNSDSASVQTTRPKKVKDPFSTVISPYYGVDELEEQANKAQTELAGDKLEQAQEIVAPIHEVVDVEDEEMENISLDQIVSSQEDEVEEMIQFSLFGDNAPLREIKESEPVEDSFDDEEEKDDLPF